MKIFSISVILAPPSGASVVLSNANDLSSFSFYQKGSVGEFMSFFSKTVAERTPQGQRQSVQENDYTAHVYNRGGAEQLAAVIITDQEYPVRPAFSLLTKLLDDFTAKIPQSSFDNPAAIAFTDINNYIQKYQDPRQADTIMRVQQELDETKIVLHKTIESVLQRGEKLDNLVDRSNALSAQSKMFYKTAKKRTDEAPFCFARSDMTLVGGAPQITAHIGHKEYVAQRAWRPRSWTSSTILGFTHSSREIGALNVEAEALIMIAELCLLSRVRMVPVLISTRRFKKTPSSHSSLDSSLQPFFFIPTMFSLADVFETVLHQAASAIDFVADSNAPLNTDGAPVSTNALDERVTELVQAYRRKPVFSVTELPALFDAALNANGVGLDDRLLLLEDLVVLMSRLSPDSAISAKAQQSLISLLYKDLPHPPSSYLAPFNDSITTVTAPAIKDGRPYAFRSADGSNYVPEMPLLGKAGSPYARSVPPVHLVPKHSLPDPGLVFDQILRRKEFVPHPGGISSLFFAFADLVIHSIFDTDHHDITKNKTSSYLDLSILYGNSESDVDQVRRKDGTGKLWDDVFSDARLLLMPPASCALLVLMNRNHNFIAERLLNIDENGTYSQSPKTDEDRRIQDDDIFDRTRLINCGFFMNIILGDYVGAILGLVADGSGWRLDPLMVDLIPIPMNYILTPVQDTRKSDHGVLPRGKGNAVSVEFNLLYRWHATLSQQDADWTEKEFKQIFKGKDLDKVTPKDFIDTAHKLLIPEPDVKKRTFGGLKRQQSGRFNDDDLARIIQDATEWRSAAYSSGCPEALRVVEILGIEQSRKWGTCSLNEFRKFLKLKPYSTFAEWNPDPRIHVSTRNQSAATHSHTTLQNAAAALYDNDIENLELHVGLQAEECKKPGPGAGLCPGYTISRAILADAVSLSRGDRYLTTEFNTKNCTQWGYDDCQYDKLDGSYGGLLTKLLFRTLPNNYPVQSAYAHFPFLVPEYVKGINPEIGDNYKWERPPVLSTATTVIDTHAGAKQVLNNPSFLSVYNDRLFTVVRKDLKVWESTELHSTRIADRVAQDLSETALVEGRTTVEKLICSSHPHNLSGTWAEYFEKEAGDLINDKSTKNDDESRTVDIVRDVINLLPVHWVAEEIFGLPLKTQSNQRGAVYEREAYEDFAALGRYVYSGVDLANDWHLRLDSESAFSELLTYAVGRFDRANAIISAAAFGQFLIDHTAVENSENSFEFATRVIAAFNESRLSSAELSAYTIAATVPLAAHFSHAIANVVDFYLGDDKKEELAEIVRLSASIRQDKENASKIMAYVHEALRINPPVSGVFRTAGENVPVAGFGTIESGDRVFVDLLGANSDATTFDNTSIVDHDRGSQSLFWYEHGLLSPHFFDSTVPAILSIIFGLKNIRRTAGNPGKLPRFTEKWNRTMRQLYTDGKGKVTPFPPSLKVDFD
ncbi:hypothetical protein DXG01_016533 [Tephrocybe rancida]|nr:hypothetical protein DXG01_016533 [Tephrocybe rancida]